MLVCCWLATAYVSVTSVSQRDRRISMSSTQSYLNEVSRAQIPRSDSASAEEASKLAPDSAAAAADDSASKAAARETVNYFEQWWPVAVVSLTDASRPHQVTVLGMQMALWYDPVAQTWSAVKDACPHRLAPLSEGRVTAAGAIECPYHGWTFAGSGACTYNPQADSAKSGKCSTVAYPTRMSEGLVWVWTQPSTPEQALPPVPVSGIINEGVEVRDYYRDHPYSYETLLDNLADVSHTPHLHRETFGQFFQATPLTVQPDAGKAGTATLQGFSGDWQGMGSSGRVIFKAPQLLHYVAVSILTYAVPTTPTRSRMFFRTVVQKQAPLSLKERLIGLVNAKARRRQLPPLWKHHVELSRNAEDDCLVLIPQEYRRRNNLAEKGTDGYRFTSRSDFYVAQVRRWLATYGNQGPFGLLPPVPPEQIPTQQQARALALDRYSQHTATCMECQRALHRLQRTANACKAAACACALAAAAAAGRSAVSAAAPLALAAAVCAYVARKHSALVDYVSKGASNAHAAPAVARSSSN